jgi:hypothetical protein
LSCFFFVQYVTVGFLLFDYDIMLSPAKSMISASPYYLYKGVASGFGVGFGRGDNDLSYSKRGAYCKGLFITSQTWRVNAE